MTELASEDYNEPVADTSLKEKKKQKKEKKRKRKEDREQESVLVDGTEKEKKEARRLSRQLERDERKKRKEEWLTKVPKVDEDGIKYTKIQLKRMMKRVKRGLPPVATEEEERERLRSEAQLRREDEAELAGLVYTKDEHEGGVEISESVVNDSDASVAEEKDSTEASIHEKQANPPSNKKAKRSKPVPPDYICQACKNVHEPVHWIYDCPNKVTVRGTNKKTKKLRGLHDPQAKKLFVSGLPFEVKASDVSSLFKSCGKVVSCKLIKFGDTGRCNGQAYVTFDTDKAAEEALKLSGTMIDNGPSDDSKKSGKKSGDGSKRKQLKLKVSKAVNRLVSKKC